MGFTSASGLLAMLDEHNDDLKKYALANLNKIVHEYWFQISGSLASVEALYEDDEFAYRSLAGLLASKVFYHLGEVDDALNYALGAGNLFDVNEQSEYVHTLVARCLDQYCEQRQKQKDGEGTIDKRLVNIVERMINRCCEHSQYEQAVGIAIEARRLDKLEEVINTSQDLEATLTYATKVVQALDSDREFRQQALKSLVALSEKVPNPDYAGICQRLLFLDNAPEVANILSRLLHGSEDEILVAYQIAFDLVETEMQSFLMQVQSTLDTLAPAAPAAPAPAAENGDEAAAMDTDAAPGAAADAEPSPVRARFDNVKDILSGKKPLALYLYFLHRNNHADLQILKNIKNTVDARVSVLHSATILANAFMHAGTTVDTFLRDNLDWLSRATNWVKFSATAGLGVIHRGHLEHGKAHMMPYLPRNGHSGSPFSEGGALYALGLIHANHSQDIKQFLLEQLRSTSNEVTQHGACLGLGLAALGTNDDEVFEDIKGVLYTDSAVAGEAAGVGMGLLLVGSASDKAQEMLAYAHDTQHEKIIRGLVLGLALIMYGREEGAEGLVEQMTRDQDPIIRYGGMMVIGLAYRGTGNNAAVQKLLHFAVSDVNDDVRRAAVMCLGFVLMGKPELCPTIVSLLAESYNPHVRYGAAMAVGLACAGSGLKEAVALLDPMLKDPTDFVRQGALIATALVLVQQPESRLGPFRKVLDKFITDKHEEVMCKMGAIMAAGIIDAGGRNVTIGLRSPSGHFRRTSVVGLAVFTQYWYWYPLSHFLSLAFQPTALVGVNTDLKMPKMQVVSNCRPSLFAYAAPLTQETTQQAAKVPTAILSTTAKARKRAKAKEEGKKGSKASAMETDEAPKASTSDAAAAASDAAPAEGEAAAAKAAEAEKAPEPSSFTIDNPARVVPLQVKHIQFEPNSRWRMVKTGAPTGILVLKDTQPDQPLELIEATSSGTQAAGAAAAPAAAGVAPAAGAAAPAAPAAAPAASADEPPPPEPFDYVPQ